MVNELTLYLTIYAVNKIIELVAAVLSLLLNITQDNDAIIPAACY